MRASWTDIDFRIGCSGWSYKHWRGDFYPQELPSTRWFDHYAAHFDTVELNNSFYRTPSAAAYARWRTSAPEGFCFAVKISRGITHFRRMKDAGEATDAFIAGARGLGATLGPLLYQFPARFERDDGRLRSFLEVLPPDLLHVFEFRHPSWRDDAVYALLRRYNAVFCAYSAGRDVVPVVPTAGDVYVRMHGPTLRYASGYRDDQLQSWIDCIRAAPGVRRAWVYFNNDGGGHATRDAARMRELVGASAPTHDATHRR